MKQIISYLLITLSASLFLLFMFVWAFELENFKMVFGVSAVISLVMGFVINAKEFLRISSDSEDTNR